MPPYVESFDPFKGVIVDIGEHTPKGVIWFPFSSVSVLFVALSGFDFKHNRACVCVYMCACVRVCVCIILFGRRYITLWESQYRMQYLHEQPETLQLQNDDHVYTELTHKLNNPFLFKQCLYHHQSRSLVAPSSQPIPTAKCSYSSPRTKTNHIQQTYITFQTCNLLMSTYERVIQPPTKLA